MAQRADLDVFSQALAGEHVTVTTSADDSPSNVNAAGQPNILVSLLPDATQAKGIWLWAAPTIFALRLLPRSSARKRWPLPARGKDPMRGLVAMALLLSFSFAGCGYHTAGHARLSHNVQTIAIPAFVNQTQTYRIEQILDRCGGSGDCHPHPLPYR